MSYATDYGYTRTLEGVPLDVAVERITESLKAEGFGVLSTIDVAATLKKKLDQDFRRYVILGACNPQLAFRALTADLSVGLLLPCNVTVFQGDRGESVVQVVKPQAMLGVVQNDQLQPIANEADERLVRALERA
ncbi:MAG: DUF302 domain-containing protein [Myxococcaceae bacterium]